MINRTCRILGVCLLSMASAAYAETRYVTDDLQLALYEQQGSKGALLKRLASGTELEVLEDSGLFAQVQAPDGTIGWTKAGFLMKTKPARALVKDLELETQRLAGELKLSKSELAERMTEIDRLRDEKALVQAEMDEQRQLIEIGSGAQSRLQKENEAYRKRLGTDQETIPLRWGLSATGLALVLGFFLGIAWFDYRSRKRHGGFRVY